jgi:hypothetical protein
MTTERQALLETIGENADRLCSLELRPGGPFHGVVHPLYRAAREELGEPLSLAAARRIAEAVSPGDFVLLATGAGSKLHLPQGETDGPLGAIALARVIKDGLGATPIILTEADYVENVVATALGNGLRVRPREEAREIVASIAVEAFPVEDDAARVAASQLFEQATPTAVIAVEKIGPNAAGVSHSATGLPVDDGRARIEFVVREANQRGVLTVGVGDNGNEIGFGRIHAAVQEIKEYGRVCQCPCGAGLAAIDRTDVMVVAGTSNWGAYAIEACLAAVIDRPDLIHGADAEEAMLRANVQAGGLDGTSGRAELTVDGTSLEVQQALNSLFRAVVQHGLGGPIVRAF